MIHWPNDNAETTGTHAANSRRLKNRRPSAQEERLCLTPGSPSMGDLLPTYKLPLPSETTTVSGEQGERFQTPSFMQGLLDHHPPLERPPRSSPTKKKRPIMLNSVLQELERCQKQGDVVQTAESWNALGLVRLHTQRNFEGAIECHETALRLLESFQSSSTSSASSSLELAVTLNDLGYCHERLSHPQQALECYGRAFEILQHSGMKESHPRFLSVQRALARLNRNDHSSSCLSSSFSTLLPPSSATTKAEQQEQRPRSSSLSLGQR